jgi:hypothetical protein
MGAGPEAPAHVAQLQLERVDFGRIEKGLGRSFLDRFHGNKLTLMFLILILISLRECPANS